MLNRIRIAGALSAFVLLAPVFAFAQETTPNRPATAPKPVKTEAKTTGDAVQSSADFCANISKLSTQVADKFTKNEGDISSKQQLRKHDLEDRQNKRVEDLTNSRTDADQNRQQIYTQLLAKSTTDAQKAAVEQFKTSLEAAVATRRTAVDAAIKTFQTGTTTLLSSRQTGVSTAETDFKAAVQSAVTAATTACSSGTASATVRQQFGAAVQAAQQKFKTERKPVDASKDQLKALQQQRDTAIKKAFDDFQASAKVSRDVLKSYFGTKDLSSNQ
jgi:hypothetical protein